MKTTSRFAVGLVLVLSTMVIGLVVGMWIGGRCCTPADSGLAGGAIVMGYGVITAGLLGLIAIPLAVYLPKRGLVPLTVGLALAGGVLGSIIIKAYLHGQAEMAAHLEQSYANMLKYRITLVQTEAVTDQLFNRVTFDWGKRSYAVARMSGGYDQVCSETLTGEQGAQMLGALRGVEGVLHEDPFPCAGTLGAVEYELELFIPERTPPNTEAKLAITAACLERYPALGEPVTVAEEILSDSTLKQACE